MRGFLFLIIVFALVGCNTTRKVSTSTEATAGSATDSASASTVVVDSSAWMSASGSTIATSTQYGVLRDSTGMPIFDASGKPITYVVQRDTVTKIVNVEHHTTASIVTHDTVHVMSRDTVSVVHETKTIVKVNSNGWWGVVWRLIVLGVLLIGFGLYVHRQR